MSYQSIGFLLFSLAVLILYYIGGLINTKLQKYVLLIGSLAFYAYSGLKYMPFIVATLITTYVGGLVLDRHLKNTETKLDACESIADKKKLRKASETKARLILWASIIIPIALLVVCKYTNFIIKTVNSVAGSGIPTLKLILPIGISFYTFMALSYVLDIYWGRYGAEKNFISYAAYLTFFPHVVQGPIDRFNTFNDQIKNGVKFDPDNITSGVMLIIWGFFKKIVIADRLGLFVDTIYNNYQHHHGVIVIVATMVYSIQIYADFSGCIDIVSGVAECFGIKLADNFNHPYFSRNMMEFWRRWHISLQEWFKDYIYFPVSMSKFVKNAKKRAKKKGKKRQGDLFATCFPIFVVWVVTGIWHGADWKFVAWGMFHAFLLISSQIFEETNAKITKALKIKTESWGWALFQMTRTFAFCCVGRVFFRASSFKVALIMFKHMFDKGIGISWLTLDRLSTLGLSRDNLYFALIAVLVLLAGDVLQEKMNVRDKLIHQEGFLFRWALIIIGVMVVVVFGIYGPGYDASAFIYQEF